MDVGNYKVGFSISDDSQSHSIPLVTLYRNPDGKLMQPKSLMHIIAENNIAGWVVGNPLDKFGRFSMQSSKVMKFLIILFLEHKIATENILMWDERYSTLISRKMFKKVGCSGDIDIMASQVILDEYLGWTKTLINP